MKLSSIIQADHILIDIPSGSKEDIIAHLLNHLWEHSSLKNEGITLEHIFDEIVTREKNISTGIGEGFAFPHARILNIKGFYMLMGLSKDGVEFESLDNKKANYFLLNIVSREETNLLLKARAAAVRFFNTTNCKEQILNAKTTKEIWELIENSQVKISQEILAKDIMRPAIATLSPEMSLNEAAMCLHKNNIDILPVIDSSKKFLGNLSCFELFRFGLPDFFMQMHSISFIKHMNPFEKYFQVDQNMTIAQLDLQVNKCSISPDTTMMEIIFEMTTKNKNKLFVIDENRLIGVIDRYTVIDKILVANMGSKA